MQQRPIPAAVIPGVSAALLVLASLVAPQPAVAASTAESQAPPIVTGDIKAGIEQHIAEQVAAGNGFFSVDFFLEGDPGAMVVTETTIHKLNGQPYYLWEQDEEQHWVRTPVDGASDEFQTVTVRSIDTPGTRTELTDRAHGNRVLFLELTGADSGRSLEIVYDVTRREKSAYPGDPVAARRHLRPERLVPDDGLIKATAESVVDGYPDDLMRARALYDHVMDEMSYKKFGEGWGQGDALFACDALYGNCTDYHAYFIGLARAVGIPARFAIGASIPSERHDGGTDGYHCWAEFYADGRWWPVDISEADKFSALSMYFFGHHPANRFELSQGRDLEVEPGPAAGPINFLAYPLLEVEGQPWPVQTLFLFHRQGGGQES